jgi:hypothetical protein
MDSRQPAGIEQSAGAMSGLLEFFADLAEWWGEGLTVIVVLLMVTSAVARGLTTLGLLLPGLAGLVVVAVILSALCVLQLAGVLVAFVRAESGRHGAAWQLANLILVLMSLGIYVETFAAVTACLWRGSGRRVDAWGGLWHAESFYLWHVVRSVPLLDVTGTLHWREPAYGLAHTPGGLVLAFKAIVILPLLQAAVSGYKLVIKHRTTQGYGEGLLFAGWTSPRPSVRVSRLMDVGRVVGRVVVIGAVTYGVTWLVLQALVGDSAFNRWWMRTALPAMQADGSPVERWAVTGPSIVLLIVGFVGLYRAVLFLQGTLSHPTWSWWEKSAALSAALAALYGVVLWAAGLLVVLARLGLGVHLPNTSGPLTVVEALAWQVAHMLPGLDVTDTLHWKAPITLDGGVTAWVVLILKLVAVGMILFLCLPVVRTAVIRTRYGPVIDAWSAMQQTTIRTSGTWSHGAWELDDQVLHWAVRGLAARPRFAELVPPLQAFRNALPGNSADQLPASANAEIVAALTAFRIRVIEHFPGAAAAVELPHWLEQPSHSDQN